MNMIEFIFTCLISLYFFGYGCFAMYMNVVLGGVSKIRIVAPITLSLVFGYIAVLYAPSTFS